MSLLLDKDRYTIWVLAPLFESEDENLSYYYDYSQSKAEYKRVFENLQLPWHWVDIRLATLEQTLDEIMAHQERKNILLNLCDGDEVNGVPGISVIHALNRRSLCYTGSDVFFYDITTSKIPMKQLFDATAVPTPPWIVLQEDTEPDWMQRIGTPLIVKPAVSAGSLGLSVQNVVQTETALKQVLNKMHLEQLKNGKVLI